MIPSQTGAFFFGCEGPVLPPEEAAFFRDTAPLGFILFARNIETPAQLSALTNALRDAVGWDCPILIDQEGGRVQRMGPPYWRQWRPALDQMAACAPWQAARAMRLRSRLIAAELRDVGIDVNCTPLGDLTMADTHPVLRNRTYGDSVEVVVGAARAVAEGQMEGGVLPILKHIPGHGRGVVDSHVGLPVVDTDLATLRATDFAVFRALSDLPMGMTAHVVYTAIDGQGPGTTSAAVLGEVRDHIGFAGLLMTDDLSMGALPGSIADRTEAALAAGCDVILHCNGEQAEMDAVAANSPRLDGAALMRAEAALALRQTPAPLDIAAAEAEFEALLNGA